VAAAPRAVRERSADRRRHAGADDRSIADDRVIACGTFAAKSDDASQPYVTC
jgi:hypothetical protein